MLRQTGSFQAEDAGGTSYTIYILTNFIDAGGSEVPNLRSFRTSDGAGVERISQGVYEIHDGPRLTSNDPAAP